MFNMQTKTNKFGEASQFLVEELDSIEVNSANDELKNAITEQGQTLTPLPNPAGPDTNTYQLSKAIIAGGGYAFLPDPTSTGNLIKLLVAGSGGLSLPPISSLLNKFIRFKTIANNTGNVQIDYGGTLYDLRDQNGLQLPAGSLIEARFYFAIKTETYFILYKDQSLAPTYITVSTPGATIDLGIYSTDLIICLDEGTNNNQTDLINILPQGKRLYVFNAKTDKLQQIDYDDNRYGIPPENGFIMISTGTKMVLDSTSNEVSNYYKNSNTGRTKSELVGGMFRNQVTPNITQYQRYPSMEENACIRAVGYQSQTNHDKAGAEIYTKKTLNDNLQDYLPEDRIAYFLNGYAFIKSGIGFFKELTTDWLQAFTNLWQSRIGNTALQTSKSNIPYDATIQNGFSKELSTGIFYNPFNFTSAYRDIADCTISNENDEMYFYCDGRFSGTSNYVLTIRFDDTGTALYTEAWSAPTGDYRAKSITYDKSRNILISASSDGNLTKIFYSDTTKKIWKESATNNFAAHAFGIEFSPNGDNYALLRNTGTAWSVYRSNDGGVSWSSIFNVAYTGAYGGMSTSLNKKRIYCVIQNQVYYVWLGSVTPIGNTLPVLNCSSIFVDDSESVLRIFVGTDDGNCYQSNDGGNLWVLVLTLGDSCDNIIGDRFRNVYVNCSSSSLDKSIIFKFKPDGSGATYAEYNQEKIAYRSILVEVSQKIYYPMTDYAGSDSRLLSIETYEDTSVNYGTPIRTKNSEGENNITFSAVTDLAAKIYWRLPSFNLAPKFLKLFSDDAYETTPGLAPRKSIFRNSSAKSLLFEKDKTNYSRRLSNRESSVQGWMFIADPVAGSSATSGKVVWNNTSHGAATEINISTTDRFGNSIYRQIENISETAQAKYMIIEDANDSTKSEIWFISGVNWGIDDGQIDVVYVANNGSFVDSNSDVIISFVGYQTALNDASQITTFPFGICNREQVLNINTNYYQGIFVTNQMTVSKITVLIRNWAVTGETRLGIMNSARNRIGSQTTINPTANGFITANFPSPLSLQPGINWVAINRGTPGDYRFAGYNQDNGFQDSYFIGSTASTSIPSTIGTIGASGLGVWIGLSN